MKKLNYLLFALLSFSFLFVSCNDEGTNNEKDETEVIETKDEEKTPKYTLTAFDDSPTYENAVIESMTYKNGTFDFVIPEGEYALGVQTADAGSKMCANSAKGQHIHLIVDNEPYSAHYTSSFDHEIEDGSHYLLSFLSRSYHESIKDELASRALKVTIDNNTIVEEEEIENPMLFYSRPKGTYVGKDTEKVMLDFYLVNADMQDHYVKALINGEEHLIKNWQPYYIENLPMGTNEITLTLVDHDGNVVETPLNPVTRNFKLEADPLK